jgi:tRNA-splicing ligase RtcB
LSLTIIHHEKLPPTAGERALLDEIAALPSVKQAIALPDLHWKEKLEAPSSVAFGVEGHIVPQLSSCAVNCGMGLVALGVEGARLAPEVLDTLFDEFRLSRVKASGRFDLDPGLLRSVVAEGAPALARHYELDPRKALSGMEDRGSVLPRDASKQDAWDALDRDILEDPSYPGLRDLGLGFDGNHFLEAQVLERVLDPAACARAGLARGQAFVSYHGGGGVVPGFVGGYYGSRSKGYTRTLRFFASRLKFHFRRPKDWLRFRERWRYYFSGARFPAIPVDGPEGKRNKVALAAAMNYGYAYRTAMLARLAWALERTLGPGSASGVRLVWDGSHNTIEEEAIRGKRLWIHRHNSARVRPGELVLLPGHHTTPSLLGVGLEGALDTLCSMPHGAGETIQRLREVGAGGEAPPLHTRRYEREERAARLVRHGGDAGLFEVARLLEERRIWRPIAALRPIGVLKNYHH